MPPNRAARGPWLVPHPPVAKNFGQPGSPETGQRTPSPTRSQNWGYPAMPAAPWRQPTSYVSEWETNKRSVSRDYAIRIKECHQDPRDHFIDHRSTRGRVVRLQEAEVGLHIGLTTSRTPWGS